MITTTMHIERPEGTIVASLLPAQYDLAQQQPRDDLGHDRDYLVYDCYLTWSPLWGIRRRDVLVDEVNIDPLTGVNVRLRVDAVEQFEYDHWEVRAQQIIGT
jgi:hypothetical protein